MKNLLMNVQFSQQLSLSMLGKNFSRQYLEIIFLFFLENRL